MILYFCLFGRINKALATVRLYRFERCGIISDIRTHLRQNLVNALKRKDLRLCKNREARSAKQYVYDMLIAEYLFSHNYSFTLSIFASEVPLLVNFCNSVPQRTTDDSDRGGSGHNKLQSDYIVHTLETLGIDPNRPEGQYIISNYMNSEAPLLLSILSSIASLVVNAQSPIRKSTYDRETQANLALEANLADASKMRAIRKKIMQQKQLYDNELKMKESKLKQQATVIKHQLSSLNAKVEEAQVMPLIPYIFHTKYSIYYIIITFLVDNKQFFMIIDHSFFITKEYCIIVFIDKNKV